jgi:hypothetical protein
MAHLENLDLPGADEVADVAIQRRLSLRASFGLSLRRLPDEQRQAFAWLGLLPEDAVITAAMARTLWGVDLRGARNMQGYLRDKALVLSSAPLPDGTSAYRLHDLIHDTARRLLSAPTQPAQPADIPGMELTLPAAHAAFLKRYHASTAGGQWHTLPVLTRFW